MAHSRNRVIIDLSALARNFRELKSILSPATAIMAVVKSDAYGHGLVPVSRMLEKLGADRLGVAHFHEAMELRKEGIALPIVILCGIRTRDEARSAMESRFVPVLSDVETAAMIDHECARRGVQLPVQVKVDTGMGRLGLPLSGLGTALGEIMARKSLLVEGLTSHLSSADAPERGFTEEQIRKFKDAVQLGRGMGMDLLLNNLANSAGVMGYRDAHFDMVRPGIMLYGGLPDPSYSAPLTLSPVMRFTGEVLQIRDMPDHAPISYGRTYYTQGRQRIAVISAGYGDGLPRSLSNKGQVLIEGKKARIVGRVCMNMTMADVTELGEVRPGAEAVFLGSQEGNQITGENMARWAETISYEVFCSIGQRNVREYIP